MHDLPRLPMFADKVRALLGAGAREKQLLEQVDAVGKELLAARENEASMHKVNVALHRDLVDTRARETALKFGLASNLQVSTSPESDGHADHPSILFNAIPKSASSYCFEVIREALGLESKLISLDYFSRDTIVWKLLEAFIQGNRIAHHHINASVDNVQFLRRCGVRTIVHVRDPRQVMISWVHHLSGSGVTKTSHHTLDATVPEAWFVWNFDRQLDWMVEHHLPIFSDWIQGWLDMEDEMQGQILFTTFDEFITNRKAFFHRILAFYGINPNEFKDPDLNPTSRPIFQFRKGELDEWRGLYSPDQKRRAEQIVPKSLLDRFDWKP